MNEKIMAINVAEVARRLGISRTSAYKAVRSGELPSLRVGRRVLVPVVALNSLLEGTVTDQKKRGICTGNERSKQWN